MEDQLPWPKPGSSILHVDGHGRRVACLKWAQGDWFGYQEGYRRAAELLFTHMAETGTGMDVLVFPFVYLWRHAIELQLKSIIAQGARLRDIEPLPQHHHKLAKLWQVAKHEIVSLDGVEPEGCATVEHILSELDALDPETTGWRFPETKQGKPNLAEPPVYLDLSNLQAVLTDVQMFLECGNTEISQRLAWVREMEADEARNYRG